LTYTIRLVGADDLEIEGMERTLIV